MSFDKYYISKDNIEYRMADINVNAISEALNNKADLDFNNCEYKPITEDTFETTDAENVKLSGEQTIDGVKTYTTNIISKRVLSFDGKGYGDLWCGTDDGNTFYSQIRVRNKANNFGWLGIMLDENGNFYTNTPTPPSASNDGNIANTKWVNNNTLTNSRTTNCLLENPKLVDLELKDGTLTLKAGSQVIIPYGTTAPTLAIGDSLNGGVISDISWDGSKLFYYVRYNEDIIRTSVNTSSVVIPVMMSSKTMNYYSTRYTVSGSTAPETGTYYWYDTTNNIAKIINDNSIVNTYVSFPFAVIQDSASGFTAILQTFQSIGYIGSDVWVGKGVKGLIPQGFNSNGSYNNRVYTTSYVSTNSIGNGSYKALLTYYIPQNKPTATTRSNYFYDIDINYNILNGSISTNFMLYGEVVVSDNKISSLKPMSTFKAVDYFDPNIDFVIETYRSGYNWYRLYKSGWCEQGGYVSHSVANLTINLHKAYKDTNYFISQTNCFSSPTTTSPAIYTSSKTTSSFNIVHSQIDNNIYHYWEAKGFVA